MLCSNEVIMQCVFSMTSEGSEEAILNEALILFRLLREIGWRSYSVSRRSRCNLAETVMTTRGVVPGRGAIM